LRPYDMNQDFRRRKHKRHIPGISFAQPYGSRNTNHHPYRDFAGIRGDSRMVPGAFPDTLLATSEVEVCTKADGTPIIPQV
jgi:hypothetical protein